MTINRDRSPSSGILVTCSECPYWHAFAWLDEDAYASGERHEQLVHDVEPRTASAARRMFEARRRHADDSATVTPSPEHRAHGNPRPPRPRP